MKWLLYLISAVFLMPLICCNGPGKNTEADTAAGVNEKNKITSIISKPIDSTNAYKLAGKWIKPKKLLEFNDSAFISNDTLYLVTCADYVYYPFGKIEKESEIKTSLLRKFKHINKVDTTYGDKYVLQSLMLNTNRLLVFFDSEDSEGSVSSYIVKGDIRDNNVKLINEVEVGMSLEKFYGTFFDEFDKSLQGKIKHVVFEPCVDGTRHIYNFKDDKLSTIQFECQACTWTVDY